MAKKLGRGIGTDHTGKKHSGKAFSKAALQKYRQSVRSNCTKGTEQRHDIAYQTAFPLAGSYNGQDSEGGWEDDGPASQHDLSAILDGRRKLELSNAAHEYRELVRGQYKSKPRRDKRKRRDQVERRVRAFEVQMDKMVDSYLSWCLAKGENIFETISPPSYPEPIQGHYSVRVVDTFGTKIFSIPIHKGITTLGETFLRYGLVPCAPELPSTCVTIRTLELYRTCSLRCPQLSIQGFVKGLCDVRRAPHRAYLNKQFSVCFDVYIAILNAVEQRVQVALKRDSPTWRLQHACPACTYKLKGENPMKFSMLITMDGNDSLKRIARNESVDDDGEGDKEGMLGESKERPDPRVVTGDYYLTREQVDKWAKEAQDILPVDTANGEWNRGVCEGRWKNMADNLTSRMWGIFEETGVFVAVCRHGFVLVVMDMVRTGEQAKYPLAATEAIIDAFGSDVAIGYDIGCKFRSTLAKSALGPRAKEANTTMLVGSFHGHAHNRICQLTNLATYVEGLGLEDLEGGERLFSKSNLLAACIRYASVFHRRQRVNEYYKSLNGTETYANLSKFLINNYKQALEIIAGESILRKQMIDQGLGTDMNVFERWIEEEHTYLTGLKEEPLVETQQMEYWKYLVSLHQSKKELDAAWQVLTPSTIQTTSDHTLQIERERRHAKERMDRNLEAVQALERALNITKTWTPEDQEWKDAQTMVAKREYQLCVDRLESLVVARMFELCKMNMSQTGYKMRKHIGTALKTRSEAIRTALDKYNKVAKTMGRDHITWDQVVQYTHLADFDLLSDTREDVRKHTWAKPASRTLLDQYYKILRAREEIERLHIEISRVITHIRDEEATLLSAARDLSTTNAALADQIYKQYLSLSRMNDIHIQRFNRLAAIPDFKGSLSPGTSVNAPQNSPCLPEATRGPFFESQQDLDDELEAEEEEEGEEASISAINMLQATSA